MTVPVQRGPSRDECRREVASWWQKHRSAPNQTAADLTYAHMEAWLDLLYGQMTEQERAEVEARGWQEDRGVLENARL